LLRRKEDGRPCSDDCKLARECTSLDICDGAEATVLIKRCSVQPFVTHPNAELVE
jgi:hypothetical protein